METEDPYALAALANIDIALYPFSISTLILLLVFFILLFFSALVSGSEVAYFSLRPSDLQDLKEKASKRSRIVLRLYDIPERLLGTILVANNFINVGIVIISTLFFVYEPTSEPLAFSIIDFSRTPVFGFIFQVILVTFFLLLFGEILPKIYATHYAVRFSLVMSYPLFFIEKVLRPVSSVLIFSTSIVRKRLIKKKLNISMDDLSDALDLPSTEIEEDEKILKGIVQFGNIDVKEIMKSRVDVFAIEIKTPFRNLLPQIIDSGYSRIPIFEKSFDNIRGILYIKDLLPHLHKPDSFKWQSLIRPPHFVPETKKINDMLEEFQSKKIHMAVVVDEYGGTHGIVTLEDILEEIVGEITDESDEDEAVYTKLDDSTYLFKGKTLLNDFYKITDSKYDIFDEIKGDADTLAGLILEIKGRIPKKNETIKYGNFAFMIVSADNRRINKIKVTIPDTLSDGRDNFKKK
ncbi:MAG: gliding motility-associated protein GldE [Bacteroidales bacterium]|nr:MAG: gliding motility-associated protein GldE [Bacteroidales bacterium]